jgi:hypothetical protein
MSDHSAGKPMQGFVNPPGMTIHERQDDSKGLGKRDRKTGRYIPIQGGSRTRLPVEDDKRIPRYEGNVGLDAALSETIFTMPTLYAKLGGLPIITAGKTSKLSGLVIGEGQRQLETETAEPPADAPHADGLKEL